MSEKETKKQKNNAQRAVEIKNNVMEAAGQEFAAEEQTMKRTEEAPKAMVPTAIGNQKVTILKHDIYRKGGDDTTESVSIVLSVKNLSDIVLGSVIFEAELFDIEGNVLDKIEQKEIEFEPGISRTICIKYLEPKSDKVRSYCVRVANIKMKPGQAVIGNEMVKIIKHHLSSNIEDESVRGAVSGTNIAIRNVSTKTIATLVFKAVFYDIEGNILDTVKHKEIDLEPNTSRAFCIRCNQKQPIDIRGYSAKIVKMITNDIEKVQLRSHEIRATDNGDTEIRGVVKNISDVKTDTVLVANFFDLNKKNIGAKVIILRDVEPKNIKQFHFIFKPMEGYRVRSYILSIGDLVEQKIG